jgi:hypothetical protein
MNCGRNGCTGILVPRLPGFRGGRYVRTPPPSTRSRPKTASVSGPNVRP